VLVVGVLAYGTYVSSGSVMEETFAIGKDTVIDFLEFIALDLYIRVAAIRTGRIICAQ
jgi:hypothetical protein